MNQPAQDSKQQVMPVGSTVDARPAPELGGQPLTEARTDEVVSAGSASVGPLLKTAIGVLVEMLQKSSNGTVSTQAVRKELQRRGISEEEARDA